MGSDGSPEDYTRSWAHWAVVMVLDFNVHAGVERVTCLDFHSKRHNVRLAHGFRYFPGGLHATECSSRRGIIGMLMFNVCADAQEPLNARLSLSVAARTVFQTPRDQSLARGIDPILPRRIIRGHGVHCTVFMPCDCHAFVETVVAEDAALTSEILRSARPPLQDDREV